MPPIPVARHDVLAARRRTRRLGNTAALHRLERQQPELAEFLMETVSALHSQMSRSRLPPKAVRRLTRQIEDLGVVLADAMAVAQVRHVQQQHPLFIPPLT